MYFPDANGKAQEISGASLTTLMNLHEVDFIQLRTKDTSTFFRHGDVALTTSPIQRGRMMVELSVRVRLTI
jgi:hypothetical protein